MRPILTSICAVLPLVAFTAPAGAQADPEAAIREIVRPILDEVPGLAVAVGRDGEIIHSHAFGNAALDPGRPVTPATRFRVYSVSKPWTAAAGLRLAGMGRIDPQGSVRTYVPDFPDKGAPITVEQLANHASGIRHYVGDEAWMYRACETPHEALDIFADDPLLHAPGTAQTYSTWGFVLLSAAIEAAAGQPFADVLRDQVFGPAGMSSAVHHARASADGNVARAYEATGDGWDDVTMTTDPSCKWGGGGFLATADDLARFPLAALGGALLPPQFVSLLFNRQDGAIHHAGGSGPGGSSHVRTDTASGLVVALAVNAGGKQGLLREASERIAATLQAER